MNVRKNFMKIGRLTILEEIDPKKMPSGQICKRVRVKCDCGKEKIVYLNNIYNGRTISCGCFKKEFITKWNKQDFDKNILIEYENKIITLAEFCKKTNLNYHFVRYRYIMGWETEDIINKPKRYKK